MPHQRQAHDPGFVEPPGVAGGLVEGYGSFQHGELVAEEAVQGIGERIVSEEPPLRTPVEQSTGDLEGALQARRGRRWRH